jgi:hypothetical protein
MPGGGGGCKSFGHGERGARPGQGAARVGPGNDGEAPRGFVRHWRGAGWKVRRRGHGGAAERAGEAVVVAHVRGGEQLFK